MKFEERQKELEERINSIKDLPKGFYKWAEEKVFIKPDWLFYSGKGAYRKCFCCKCGKSFEIKVKRGESYEAQFEKICEMPKRNQMGKCPECGAKIMYKTGLKKERYEECSFVYAVQRFQKHGAVIRYIEAFKTYGPHMQNTYKYTEIGRAFFYEDRKKVQKDWHLRDYSGSEFWSDRNRGGLYNIAMVAAPVYMESLKCLKNTVLEYSAFKEYVKWQQSAKPMIKKEYRIAGYMEAYRKYPVLEMLVKSHCDNLVNSVIWNAQRFKMNARGKTPADMLEIYKFRIKDALCHDSSAYMCWYQKEKKEGRRLDDGLIEFFADHTVYPEDINFIADKMSLKQIKNYLEKQKAGRSRIGNLINNWSDYLDMAKKLGMDTNDMIVYKPKDINAAHDRLTETINRAAVEDEEKKILGKFLDINKNLCAVKKKFEYEGEQFIIRVPESVGDILREGRSLHHCVSSDRYFDRINRDETYILFLRRKEAPDISYYTLEVQPGGTVRQKRTEYNRQPDIEEIEQFITEWQQVIRKRLKATDMQLDDISRKKRSREMEELKLKSPVFAATLENDLMEIDIPV